MPGAGQVTPAAGDLPRKALVLPSTCEQSAVGQKRSGLPVKCAVFALRQRLELDSAVGLLEFGSAGGGEQRLGSPVADRDKVVRDASLPKAGHDGEGSLLAEGLVRFGGTPGVGVP
jgi:hypothetical protein